MNIALFTDTFPPDVNGVANSTAILFTELKKNGHHAYVIAPGDETGWDENHEILRLAGVEIKQLYGYVVTSPFHIWAMNEIRHLDLDMIHAQTEFGVGILARMCSKTLSIPLVSTYHTTYEDYTHYANPMNLDHFDSVAKKAVARLSKLYGDTSIKVIAPSNKTKRLLEKYKVEPEIFVVPTGLQLDKFSPSEEKPGKTVEIRSMFGIEPEGLLIIYVGRIAEEKALDLVIHGFHQAIKDGTGAKLLIVGGGPDEEKLHRIVKDLGDEEKIVFAGKVPSDLVGDYYRASDAFVSASLSETQGMTFIEALAAGLPLFARYDEVLDDLLIPEKTGWFFDSVDSLGEKILLLEQKSIEERKKMKENCLEQVKPYSSEVFYERVMAVYHSALRDYEYLQTIEDVRVKGEFVQLYLKNGQGEENRVLMTLDDYYYEGIRRGTKITNRKMDLLRKNEENVLAYQSCLRKIAAKDRTRKELKDWLSRNTECEADKIEEILEKLEAKGYINDERYAEEAVNRMHYALLGEGYILRDLEKRGIPRDVVFAKLNALPDEEFEHAKNYAERIRSNMKDDSVKMKKNRLITRMIQHGFSSAIADEVIADLDFSEDEMREVDSLRKCALKARKRYERKYSDSRLRNTIYRYCAAQGYATEDIYAILDEMEWEDD